MCRAVLQVGATRRPGTCSCTVVFVLSPVRCVRAYSTVCRAVLQVGATRRPGRCDASARCDAYELYNSFLPEPRAMRTSVHYRVPRRTTGRCDASTSYVRRVDQLRATRRPATCDASTSYAYQATPPAGIGTSAFSRILDLDVFYVRSVREYSTVCRAIPVQARSQVDFVLRPLGVVRRPGTPVARPGASTRWADASTRWADASTRWVRCVDQVGSARRPGGRGAGAQVCCCRC